MMKDMNEWGKITENITTAIKTSGKTKTQIAKEIGVSKATLSQYLSGRAFPSLTTLKNLCKALDCTYEEILGE